MPQILSRIRLPKYGSAPSSPVAGDMYYNTTTNKVFAYNGTSWVDLGATGGGGGSLDSTGYDARDVVVADGSGGTRFEKTPNIAVNWWMS